MAPLLSGRHVLVTGSNGAFGQAFVRRALADGAARVVALSRGEAAQAAMAASIADDRVRYLIGDVRDERRMRDACRGVEIVVHAAALKRIDSCESDPREAIATNVIGTLNVARACIDAGVSLAVFLSTDKAAAPATLYGATKLAAERAWNASNVYAAGTRTRFFSTRYGNVLGSTGSVVPLWRAQSKSGTLSITDVRASRFWMTMTDAVDLVLLALADMRSGAVYIPKLDAARLTDLAYAIAPGCTLSHIGLRPGEKLHECLVTEDEARHTYDCGSHYLIEPETRTWGGEPALLAPRVPLGFTYESDDVRSLSVDILRQMVAA